MRKIWKKLKLAADEELLLLGEYAMNLIYDHVDTFRIEPFDVIKWLKAFNETLSNYLGSGAKKILEKSIARNLYGKLDLAFEEHVDWSLEEYVFEAEKSLRRGSLSGEE